MRESFQRPKQVTEEHEEALAVIGRRLERWDVLSDTTLSLEERRKKVLLDIESEIQALQDSEEEYEYAETRKEVDDLISDAEELREMESTEIDFDRLCAQRKAYYSDIRDVLLRNT